MHAIRHTSGTIGRVEEANTVCGTLTSPSRHIGDSKGNSVGLPLIVESKLPQPRVPPAKPRIMGCGASKSVDTVHPVAANAPVSARNFTSETKCIAYTFLIYTFWWLVFWRQVVRGVYVFLGIHQNFASRNDMHKATIRVFCIGIIFEMLECYIFDMFTSAGF